MMADGESETARNRLWTFLSAAMSGPSQLKLTPFEVAPFLDQRNLSSRFVKNERQSWFSRRGTDQDWSDDVETKRRRLMGSEEELEGTPMRLNVVSTAPEGGLSRPAPSPHQVRLLLRCARAEPRRRTRQRSSWTRHFARS